MKPPYQNEIRDRLLIPLRGTQSSAQKMRVHLPARDAHASVRPPVDADASALLSAGYGSLYGATLVGSVTLRSGWLLFLFTPDFFSALVEKINREMPLPEEAGETHAENRMRALARHEGSGCPNQPAFHRALILALAAHESAAAYRKAEQAALKLFHTIPPRERPAFFCRCGALGGAMLRLLSNSRSIPAISRPT